MRKYVKIFLLAIFVQTLAAQDLPVDLKQLETGVLITNPLDKVFKYQTVLVHMTEQDIHGSIEGCKGGLLIDFSKIKKLVDGRIFDPGKLSGEVSYGAYPFVPSEIKFEEKYFQASVDIKNGKALIDLNEFFSPLGNANDWKDNGSIVIRFKLIYENKLLGVPDIYCAFEKADGSFQKLPWFTEWPSINNLNSETPGHATICFRTDASVNAIVKVKGLQDIIEREPATLHKIPIDGLEPGKLYTYQIAIGKMHTPLWTFRSAPLKGSSKIKFAVAGDSGAYYGVGMQNYLGCNYEAREVLLRGAKSKDCEFLLTLGDLSRGYSVDRTEFCGELRAAKDSLNAFWRHSPVYTLVGNHEMLANNFYFSDLKKQSFVQIDKWPYQSDSTESVFKEEFYNPMNAPKPSDHRRPTYDGTVYSFIYGPVKVIVLNNDYWFSRYSEKYGGAPYGVILDDQMEWLEREIKKADSDNAVKFIFVAMHCPPFPAGEDAHMWHFGDNTVRAYTFTDGNLIPQKTGLVEQRNKLAMTLASSPKMAAVFSGHEHNYSKRLIDKTVPAGVPAKDDADGNGKIDWPGEKASPIEELKHPLWYIVSGSSGSRPCAGQNSPWDNYWKEKNPEMFKFSMQRHFIEIETSDNTVSLKVFNSLGEKIDEIPDLMAIKKGDK